jgi:putative OmpL-like beta-barrel porin-2
MGAIYGTQFGDFFKENRIKMYGWITAAGNFSNSKNSNTPASYWIVPNTIQMDQYVFRIERETDSVQTDHIDWGFRSTHIYGIDYRYTTAGGWFSDQLLRHNDLYGYDPLEQYFDLYIPGVAKGWNIRIGRWVACPDIETQLAPDNFLGSHSLLFTFDTYTQTGILNTFLINDNWMVQGGIHAGTDMAPWYQGATPTGMFGVRWVSNDNKDSIYTDLNAINNAKFRYFKMDGQLVGHDNFNYAVSTWQHKFSNRFQTRTEGYFMWQNNAVTGGTPSIGPTHLFGGGGGIGKFIPGTSLTYGVLNYTMYALTKSDYITFRNEWWRDQEGERSGFKSNYSSTTLGLSHQFTSNMMVRPEIAYYHSYDVPAFDLGKHKDMLVLGCDFTIRF